MAKGNAQPDPVETLAVLYERHGADILRYLFRLVGPKMAEDVLQETFVQALSHLDRLDGLVSPKAWLFTVARNTAMNVLRKKRLSVDIPWDSLVQANPGHEEDGRLELMRTAILKLPSECREMLLFRWYDDLSYEEIAQTLKIPIGTVRSRLHHALRKLRLQINKTATHQ